MLAMRLGGKDEQGLPVKPNPNSILTIILVYLDHIIRKWWRSLFCLNRSIII